MILLKDSTSWEAAFFSVYLRAVNAKLSEIAEAVVDVLDCLDRVLSLIKNYTSNHDEQINAVKEVSSCCSNTASLTFTFYHAAILQSEIDRLWDVVNDASNIEHNLCNKPSTVLIEIGSPVIFFSDFTNRRNTKTMLI